VSSKKEKSPQKAVKPLDAYAQECRRKARAWDVSAPMLSALELLAEERGQDTASDISRAVSSALNGWIAEHLERPGVDCATLSRFDAGLRDALEKLHTDLQAACESSAVRVKTVATPMAQRLRQMGFNVSSAAQCRRQPAHSLSAISIRYKFRDSEDVLHCWRDWEPNTNWATHRPEDALTEWCRELVGVLEGDYETCGDPDVRLISSGLAGRYAEEAIEVSLLEDKRTAHSGHIIVWSCSIVPAGTGKWRISELKETVAP